MFLEDFLTHDSPPPLSPLLTCALWVHYVTILCFSFFICKMLGMNINHT